MLTTGGGSGDNLEINVSGSGLPGSSLPEDSLEKSANTQSPFKEEPSFFKGEGAMAYSASLPGVRQYHILVYGPLAMGEDVLEILAKNHLGARVYSCDGENHIFTITGEIRIDLLVYHVSKRDSLSPKLKQLPIALEAVLLGYGVTGGYPEKTIQRCKDDFEKLLIEKLRDKS